MNGTFARDESRSGRRGPTSHKPDAAVGADSQTRWLGMGTAVHPKPTWNQQGLLKSHVHVQVRVPIFGFPTFRQQPPKSTQHAPATELGRILATARSMT